MNTRGTTRSRQVCWFVRLNPAKKAPRKRDKGTRDLCVFTGRDVSVCIAKYNKMVVMRLFNAKTSAVIAYVQIKGEKAAASFKKKMRKKKRKSQS